MRRILLLLTIALVVFIALNRQRIYLRDPLAAVYRNEVKQDGDWVFINYSNDVLVQSGGLQSMRQIVVQSFNGVPGVPAQMNCVLGVACLAQADQAPNTPLAVSKNAVMSNREVSFTESDGTKVRITLR
jgi:hypothetical protein